MATTIIDISFCTIYNFNRYKQKYNRPLNRLNLTNPYYNEVTGEVTVDIEGNAITRERLDMRRKAEILKYSSNKMSTQTNSITSKEKWAQIARSKGSSSRLFVKETAVCPNTETIYSSAITTKPLPSSASGVPGSMYLYEDPRVPLYNYTNTFRTYAFDVPNINAFWETTVNTNIKMTSNTPNTIFALSINKNINVDTAKYTLIIPVGISVEGQVDESISSITTDISYTALEILYNGKPLTGRSNTTDKKSMVIELQNSNGASNVNYKATQYVGNITFSDITLSLSHAYVFEFVLTVNMSCEVIYKSGYTPSSHRPIYYAYANMTDETIEKQVNCRVTNKTDNTSAFTPPSLFGV